MAGKYEALLAHPPNLTVADVTRDVARRAAQLRAAFRLRPADARQVANAMVNGATAFVTNDRGLEHLGATLDLVLLDDLL